MAETIRTTSICLTKEMLTQIEWLKNRYGEGNSRIVSRALDMLYREQMKISQSNPSFPVSE
jgi:hypothetical protein